MMGTGRSGSRNLRLGVGRLALPQVTAAKRPPCSITMLNGILVPAGQRRIGSAWVEGDGEGSPGCESASPKQYQEVEEGPAKRRKAIKGVLHRQGNIPERKVLHSGRWVICPTLPDLSGSIATRRAIVGTALSVTRRRCPACRAARQDSSWQAGLRQRLSIPAVHLRSGFRSSRS